MSRIIGLTGYAQVGKDTAAAGLVEGFGFEKAAFADGLREFMIELDPFVIERKLTGVPTIIKYNASLAEWGYEETKRRTDARDFMVKLGAGARNILGPDVWIDAVRHKIERERDTDWVVTDVRYANEVSMIHDLGGEVWLITREGCGPANEEEERSLEDVYPSRWIFNNGTVDDLQAAAAIKLDLYDQARGGRQLEFGDVLR